MAAHLVAAIDVRDFGAQTVRVGDLNGDGAPDLLFVQNVRGPRTITCLTATTIHGEKLWQHGTPSADHGEVYCDLPVQVSDWDHDGRDEVLFVRQAEYLEVTARDDGVVERALRYGGTATMVVLDGLTGEEKHCFPIPAPADDSFLFADLTGRGRREDFIVKDRYWNMWGLSAAGDELWHWEGSVGHYPAIADVDGDGCDEVFVGYALVDHDGTVLFDHPHEPGEHQDAAYIVHLPDGSWRLLFGNGGIHCLTPDGTVLWHHPLREAQHVVAGHFRPELGPVQFMVIDRGFPRAPEGSPGVLYLYDLEGNEVWRRVQPPGSWCSACVEIDWSGHGEPREVVVYSRGAGNPVAVFDGHGEIVDEVDMVYTPDRTAADRKSHHYVSRADVWGDSRQEIILFGTRGACIWSNARPLALPTLYNNTLYPGM